MNFLRLLLRNALRGRLRTFLTVCGSAFLMFVLVFMLTALSEMDAWQGTAATHLRIAVQHGTGLANSLPITLEPFLRGETIAPHGYCICKLNWFGGIYLDPHNFFARFATDHLAWRELFDEFAISQAHYDAWCAQKDSCVVGAALAAKYHWSIGQRVTVLGDIYPIDVTTEIVGIFNGPTPRDEEVLYFRWDYFDELLGGRKLVGTYWLKARTPEDIPKLKELIDAHTRNSPDPTETMTENEFGQQFMEMMGNVKGLVMNLGGVLLVIMVLMTANTVAMSARERVVEVAVLRTLGFRRIHVLGLFLGEAVLVSLAGAVLSLGISYVLFNVLRLSPAPEYFPYFLVERSTMVLALAASVGCGLASAAIPALRSARRPIVDGLRQII
ncbi:MAG: ABC transporter permease [Planctomycetes bacterium]|nr:ABC transporter permease [Planctomycetota bacterium]